MKSTACLAAIYILSMFIMGCTKATPGFDVLDSRNIPQPLFNGKTTQTLNTSSDSVTFNISGECDYKITGIVAQAVGISSEQSLGSLAASLPSVGCQSNGKFSFVLKSLADLGYHVIENQTYEIQLRGMTSSGLSNPSIIRIVYANGNNPRSLVITSGGTESSTGTRQAASTSFRAVLRVDHRMLNYTDPTANDAMTTASSAHFKAKIGAAARAN